MRSTLGAVVLALALSASPACRSAEKPDDPLASYRPNVGKTAFNPSNGVRVGRITGVVWKRDEYRDRMGAFYKVEDGGLETEVAADTVEAR